MPSPPRPGRARRRRRLWVAAALLVLAAAGPTPAGFYLWALSHFHAARSALARGHNPQAVRNLQVCLRVWPNDPDVLLMAARAARRACVYDDAARCLDKYQKARGLDEAGSFEQLLLTTERDVDGVAELCRRRVEQGEPEVPLILEALVRGYLRQYRLAEAGACLDRWLQSEPDNPQALCLRGHLHLDYEHQAPTAAQSFRRAVQLDPENEEARLGLALALLQNKECAEALPHLEYLRRYQPDNLRVEVGLAECRIALGQSAEAARMLDELLARQPRCGPALSLRGQMEVEAGDYAAAEGELRQAIAFDPSDHRARYNLVLCLRALGRGTEADEQRRQMQQWEEDLERFQDIVTRDMGQRPHDPALHVALGQLLLRSGQKEEGLRWLNSALREDPGYAPARQALADYARHQAEGGTQPSGK